MMVKNRAFFVTSDVIFTGDKYENCDFYFTDMLPAKFSQSSNITGCNFFFLDDEKFEKALSSNLFTIIHNASINVQMIIEGCYFGGFDINRAQAVDNYQDIPDKYKMILACR